MKRNLLVPCDFSPESREAYQFALQLASRTGGSVHVLKAVDLPVMYESALGAAPYYFDPTLIRELKDNARVQFDKLVAQYPSAVKVEFTVKEGPVTPTIRQFIADHGIDLVVMGTRGASGLEEYLIGSNTEKVVRFSPVPVFAVRKSVPLESIRNIVFPTTLESQPELMREVKALQEFFGARLHLVLVNTPYNLLRTDDELARMKSFAEQHQLSNYTLNTRDDFREPNAIINFANEMKADLIAMGTHGRRGLAHFFTGSITESVVNHMDGIIWTFSTHKSMASPPDA
ncbi:MAG: universal stress protein [Cyclobacteriaceae bacterium]|nr:universal stress protein [Cyclobacteriaceae bacterium]